MDLQGQILRLAAVFFGAWLPLSVAAQSPVDILIERDWFRRWVVPALLEHHRLDIESELKRNFVDLNTGFERSIPIDRPFLDLVGRENAARLIEDMKAKILGSFETKEDREAIQVILEDLEDRVRFWRIRYAVDVRILPNASKLSVQTLPAASEKSLADMELTVWGKPEVEVLEQTKVQLVEFDPASGRENVLSQGIDLGKAFERGTRIKMSDVSFKLHASVIDDLSPEKPFRIEINEWQSSFGTAMLEQEALHATIDRIFQERVFREAFLMIAQSQAGRQLIGGPLDKAKKSQLEEGLKRFLDQKRVDLVLWLERRPGRSPKFQLSSAEMPETYLKLAQAQSDERLMGFGLTQVSLKGEDLDLEIDPSGHSGSIVWTSEQKFSPVIRMGLIQLANELTQLRPQDPSAKRLVERLSSVKFFENEFLEVTPHFRIQAGQAECRANLGWHDGVPQWDLDSVDVDLCLLDQTVLDAVDVRFESGENLRFDLRSEIPLDVQFFNQILPIVTAHQKILPPDFFDLAGDEVLRVIESKIVGRSDDQALKGPGGASFVRTIESFALWKQGGIRMQLKPSSPWRPSWKEIANLPAVDGMPSLAVARVASQKAVADIEIEMDLPSTIGLRLSKVRSEEGDVSDIRFSAVSPQGQAPKIRMRFRLINDESGAGLIAIPMETDFSEVEALYKIPTEGEGRPEIGVVRGKGVKGALASSVHGAALAWDWIIKPKLSLSKLGWSGAVTEAAVSSTAASASAFVRQEEIDVVNEILRSEFDQAKQQIKEDVMEIVWTELNGDLAARLALVRDRGGLASSIFTPDESSKSPDDAWMARIALERRIHLNRGLLGDVSRDFLSGLKMLKTILPVDSGVGKIPIDGEPLKDIVDREGEALVRQTLGSQVGGLEDVSTVIGNATLAKTTTKLRSDLATKAERIVSENASQIDLGIIDFIRFGSRSSAPLSELVTEINRQFSALMQQPGRVATEMVAMPTYCGSSIMRERRDDQKDYYRLFANFTEMTGVKPPVIAERPPESLPLSLISQQLDTDGAFVMGLSTDFLEQIAKDRRNLDRLESEIEAEAKRQAFVNDDFALKIHRVRIGMNADGGPVARVAFNVSQSPNTVEKVLGFLGLIVDAPLSGLFGESVKPFAGLGSLVDRVTDPAFEIDGDVELEIPFGFAMGDVTQSGSGQHTGHYLGAYAEPKNFKIRSKELKWGNLFESAAFRRAEDQVKNFSWYTSIDQPFSIPGYETLMTFRLGRSLDTKTPWTELVTSVDLREGSEGLYKGQFLIRSRIDFKKPVVWPRFEVAL